MVSDFNSRVRERRQALNLTQAQLAKRSGIPQSTIAHIENSRNKSVTKLLELAAALETTPEYLMHGKGEKHYESIKYDDKTEEDVIIFDRLDISGRMGGGIINEDYPSVVDQIKVTTAWARRHIGINLSHIRLITAKGDSMHDTIEDGEVLFLDTSVTEYKNEGIYAITDSEGGLRIKRLLRHIDGRLSIISDNSRYPTETLLREQQEQIRICGKVVAHSFISKL